MTLKETAKAVYSQCVAGYVNRQKMTYKQFENYLRCLFRGTLKLGNRAIIEIALPDGWWLTEIIHYNDKDDGYDYSIPETIEQNSRLWTLLTT